MKESELWEKDCSFSNILNKHIHNVHA